MGYRDKKMKEGMYHLYNPSEKEPVLVHGYYCEDEGNIFGFGFNTHDGGGFMPYKDLSKDSVVVPVNIVETKEGSVLEQTKRGQKFLCEENDNTIEYVPEEGEFYIGNETGVGGWWVIGKRDLVHALMEFGITVE